MTAAANGGWLETYRGVVYPRHLDHMGHMNVAYYVEKFDEGIWHLFAAVGLTPSYLRAENRGMAAVEMKVTFQSELFAGDLVIVRSGLLAVTGKSLRFVQEMRNGESGQLASVQTGVAVHLDREARRAVPLAEEIAARAREHLVEYEEA